MRRRALLPLLLLAVACQSAPPRPPVGEGTLAVPGGTIWYKVSGTGNGVPLVLLHGGPGFSSFYLKPFEDLGDGRVVVRYDQLGGGKSSGMTDTSMMNIPHFVAELDSLRAFLKIPKWHVLGHSWGTILAFEYYKAHPDRVASLIFASPVFDVPAFSAHARDLVKTLSDSAQRAIAKAEATGDFSTPGYQAAINEFYGLYVWRHPVQADLDSTMSTVNQAIYDYMQGPSEFTISGTLRDYNVVKELSRITVPTMFSYGEFDEVGGDLTQSYADQVQGSINVVFYGAAHMTPWDSRDASVAKVREFLWKADSTSRQQ